jgi:acetyltransferase-like isoleucine patch superfamily enzyme
MKLLLKSLLNRWRRRLWRALFFRMVFGERASDGRLLPHTRIAPSSCIEGESGLQLADHVFIGQFNFIEASGGVSIEEGVQITNYVSIVSHSSHRAIRLLGRSYVTHRGEMPGYVKAPIRIGAYSFIGPHSLIEAGARIGRGVVVSAFSQVRGELPDFAIVAGQPARVIGDVRAKDAQLLAQHPWLAAHYQAWADEMPGPASDREIQ